MNIVIKRLVPELTSDYINFFENVAFSDNQEWDGCYCVWYHWNDILENERKKYNEAGGTCFNRELAIKYIQKGVLQGYLAYVEGLVVGWCNANDKASYDGLSNKKRPELWEGIDCSEKVKSIVCFTIAPNMRRKGIATQLLNRVCMDASLDGYTYVEAYPGTGETNSRSYHGPYTIYDKSGFSVYKDLGGEVIVRKYL
ncbi:GNAT family N-acetyltransferase [Oceanirhabdus sp. W0125-5]|uniref:GNAT family N-acetyltransferase n=1 Tax=Oceanirhabdus sp. W0125-5 TaxID=2999116 RepID=UPI0022F342B0|nr:GNAT family N-acetyltransferase [Oceanirhabdus sp. W0125-5]WBW98478.1 GNAT family N-acetyltransferase [Oceanirhabdus sp. W0125-5]